MFSLYFLFSNSDFCQVISLYVVDTFLIQIQKLFLIFLEKPIASQYSVHGSFKVNLKRLLCTSASGFYVRRHCALIVFETSH